MRRFQSCSAGLITLWFTAARLYAATDSKNGEEDALTLSPPHAEMPPTFWEQYGTSIVVAALVVLMLVGTVLWWLLQARPSIPVPIEISSRKELEALRQMNEDGQVLSQVSRVLRRYVAGAFGLPPDELTTTEFCRFISAQENIGHDFAERVGGFLRQCDELKFAPAGSPTPIGAAARALQLLELGEARRAYLRTLEATSNLAQPATHA